MSRLVEFENGSYVIIPDNVQETDEVQFVDKNGARSQVLWGSLIAITHGEVLQLLEN